MTWKIVNHHDFSTPWTVTKRIAFSDFYQQKGETKKARSWEIRQFSSTPRLEISCCCLWELWLPEAELQCLTEWDAPEWLVNYGLPLCTNKEQRLHLNLNPNSFKKTCSGQVTLKKRETLKFARPSDEMQEFICHQAIDKNMVVFDIYSCQFY